MLKKPSTFAKPLEWLAPAPLPTSRSTRSVLLNARTPSPREVVCTAERREPLHTASPTSLCSGRTARWPRCRDNITSGELLAGFSNREKSLEVKVQIKFEDAQKPILAPICMFLTTLKPEENCERSLLAKVGTEWHPHVWQIPIELTPEGKLAALA
jgi:hypothetical protein